MQLKSNLLTCRRRRGSRVSNSVCGCGLGRRSRGSSSSSSSSSSSGCSSGSCISSCSITNISRSSSFHIVENIVVSYRVLYICSRLSRSLYSDILFPVS